MKGGLFWKILLSFWLTLLCIITGLWLVLVAVPRSSPEQWIAKQVASSVLPLLAREVERGGTEAFEAARSRLPHDNAQRLTIYPATVPPADVDEALSREATAPGGHKYLLVYAARSTGRRGGPFAIPLPVLIAGGIAGLAFSILLAWYLTQPINLLREGFDQLAQGNLHVRLQARVGRRRDEIAGLARDFDIMAARLTQLVVTRDRLLHDVSHELRSPLSRMQLAIALARQDSTQFETSMARIEREMVRLDALVGELLILARAESGLGADDEYFDPVAMLEVVVEDARFEAEPNDVQVAFCLPDVSEEQRPPLRGSAELFRRALENIIRNALRFAPASSVIEVTAAAELAAYRFSVRDHGPGVSGLDLGTLFDPFIRADQAGFGLGLAIAKRAVAAHGGGIDARNVAGGGFEVEIVVPFAQAASASALSPGL